MELPKDPYMLLSVVNMKLRDFYPDLDEMCKSMCADKNEICEKLSEIGYKYNEQTNQFSAK